MRCDAMMKSLELEKELGIRDGLYVPYLQFKPDWKVKVIFPFGGAAARFCVKCGNAEISVYLDVKDQLGCVGEPYWEIYPNEDGDCDRFLMNEHEELINGIQRAIDCYSE